MKILKLILGFLLEYPTSNAKQLPIHSDNFYSMKSKILKRYGTMIGYDKQYIERICYDCRGLGEVNYVTCPKCDNGTYEKVWIKLSIVRLGRNEFHTYGRRFKKYNPKFKYRSLITGYVEHKKMNRFMTLFALYILLLFFNRKLLKRVISNRY